MIKFLFLGLLRDRQRSLVPAIVVASGVMLTVFLHAWITGLMKDGIELNARFSSGHLKITTQAYAREKDQLPNDLALVEIDSLMQQLRSSYPHIQWNPRIRFGGLLDVAGPVGETRAQGPAMGMAINMLSEDSGEIKRLNLRASIIEGSLPDRPGEILISKDFAGKLQVKPGDQVTWMGSTMHGSMAISNFTVAGLVVFGANTMDRGSIIVDLADAQQALDMENASSEILGFFGDGYYDDEQASTILAQFNRGFTNPKDEFSAVMSSLRSDNMMAMLFDYSDKFSGILIGVFILVMSIVLWNAGLLGGLRRYGEFGLRLAMGETHGQIYRTQCYESLMIAGIGTIAGTLIGLVFAWIVQEYGINAAGMMKNASMMLPTTFHARITPATLYIGFFPGVVSTVTGTLLSGLGIYKRKTSQLFKELEN